MLKVLKVHTGPLNTELLISEVLKVHTGPSIQNKVTHVKGVESAYRVPQYRVMLLTSKTWKMYRAPKYRVILLMSEVSRVLRYIAGVKYCEQRIKCYVCQRCQK